MKSIVTLILSHCSIR